MIGRNILANVLGGSWSIILLLLIIPIQIRIFGLDAYGLLAFLASLHVMASVFDLGLSPTIAREVAIDTSPDLQHSRDLLQSLSVGYLAIGLLLGGLLIAGADWLVSHWLKLGALPAETARSVLMIGGLTLMLRWPVSFLSGVITGRGRFDILNLLKASASTIGLLGGALIAIAFSDLVLFAAWMALSALVEVTMYLAACFRLLPGLTLRPRVSARALVEVWRYALSMSLIGIVGIAIVQSDRLLLSNLVPIETLGYYSLAVNVVGGLSLAQGFVTSALFPTFAAKYSRGAKHELVSIYNWATQGLVALYTLPMAALTFFGSDILRIWTSIDTVAPAAQLLTVLAPGYLLNAPVAIAATLAVATGYTGIVLRVNSVNLLFYVPMLYVAIVRWGGVGAAAVWLVLNVSYFFSFIPVVQERIVGQTTKYWVGRNLLPFFAVGALSFGLARGALTLIGWDEDVATWTFFLVATLTYGLCGLLLLDPGLRRQLCILSRRLGNPFCGEQIYGRRNRHHVIDR